MDLLALPSDIFNLILNMLKLEDKVILYSLSHAYRQRLEKKWSEGLKKYSPLTLEERAKVKRNHINAIYNTNYMNYMKQRYNRMSLYVSTFNSYDEVNKICKNRIYSVNDNSGISGMIDIKSYMRPYYWKEVFNNLNEYLKKKNRPLIKEKNVNTTGLAITDIPYLKYRESCIKCAETLVEEFKVNNKITKYTERMKKIEKMLPRNYWK